MHRTLTIALLGVLVVMLVVAVGGAAPSGPPVRIGSTPEAR